jgi:hypothetical protein
LNNKSKQISEGKMTNETTENFIKAWSEFRWPDPVVASFRLYYSDDGSPKCYSMEELSDKYVEVDADTFALRPWNVRVVEGKLTYVQPPVTVQKLKPNTESGTPCDPQDVCVIVSDQQTHIKWKPTTNETY